MTTELDELAARAANDPGLSGNDVQGFIISAIQRPRCYWAEMPDQSLPLDAVIGVGVGYAALTRDGVPVYEEAGEGSSSPMTVAQAEALACREPERDWRIHLIAQLEDRHYRRTGAGLWGIYERGHGMS